MAYRGSQFTFPAGQGRLTGNVNHDAVPLGDLITYNNGRYDGQTWRKAPGITAYDTVSGGPNILGAINYTPASGTHRIITACSDGAVYRESSGDIDDATLVSGLTFTDPVIFVPAGEQTVSTNRKLLMFSKGVTPYYIDADASTMTALTNVPSDWASTNQPAAAVYHDSRIAAWGNDNFTHAIYFSNLLDHTDFSTSDPPIIDVAPGFSEGIRCCFSYLPETLYVWKFPLGIFRLDTSNITGLVIPRETIKTDIGGGGPRGVARVKDDVWFISNNGHIHSLTAVQNAEDTRDSDITALLGFEEWIADTVDLSAINNCVLHYDSNRQEVWAMYRSKSSVNGLNDIGLVIDVGDPQYPRPAIENRGEYFETIFKRLETDGTFQSYCGGVDGIIRKLNQTARSIDGIGYSFVAEYPENDFSSSDPALAEREKRYDALEISINPTGSQEISAEVFVDGISRKTIGLSLGTAGTAVYDDPVLGIYDTARYVGGEVVSHKVPLGVRGRRIGVKLSNSGANEDVAITKLVVHYMPQGTEIAN